jgi:hypothetical protein
MIREQTTKRRWYQFSLRTMLVTMIVASAVFGSWVHWSREWIRQRQEWRSKRQVYELDDGRKFPLKLRSGTTTAPCGLWLFGETGLLRVVCYRVNGEELDSAKEARRLFPEAEIAWADIVTNMSATK